MSQWSCPSMSGNRMSRSHTGRVSQKVVVSPSNSTNTHDHGGLLDIFSHVHIVALNGYMYELSCNKASASEKEVADGYRELLEGRSFFVLMPSFQNLTMFTTLLKTNVLTLGLFQKQ